MRAIRIICTTLIALLSGCASAPEHDLDAMVSVASPEHYDVVVENFELEASGVRHWQIPLRKVGCCWKGAHGPRGPGGSLTPFPDYIAIQWFSLAEQKHYQRLFSLPKNLQDRMREPASYKTSLGTFERPRDIMTIGLAPGGTIVVWIQNQIGNEIEVARMQANEIEGDPGDYRATTKRYLEENADYLKQHGVPTKGW
ncbi:DUF2931 family protein [Marinobacter sp. R17]|uniref:DUF2931 family protein n=1 Tax=Marinobacter sp. R17 TaxID=2484250 RepID=UPI000F4C6E26|nr:DUF2931 family protein [Marinobacter sp. R17]ROT93642.1 DUF2931 family protein [Marinobacter sp. R17]